jgi:hypothetical protein
MADILVHYARVMADILVDSARVMADILVDSARVMSYGRHLVDITTIYFLSHMFSPLPRGK